MESFGTFTQAKRRMLWKTTKCGGLISSCCPRNSHGKADNEKRKKIIFTVFRFTLALGTYVHIFVSKDTKTSEVRLFSMQS